MQATTAKIAKDLELVRATDHEVEESTNTEPTAPQSEAGNYKKAKVRWNGLRISIENPKGSVRRGVDRDGQAWESRMYSHYGYILGSKAVDGDHVDVFIGSDPNQKTVYVIDQVDPATGEYDEPKCMIGYFNENDARTGYLENYDDDWQGLGDITPMTVDEFKRWALSPAAKKPAVQAFDKAASDIPLADLQTAKHKSDRGEYKAKAALLNSMMSAHPDQFIVDYTGKGHPGITHVPTGFKFHTPLKSIPGAVKRAQEDEATVAVRPGETLSHIAHRHGTTVASILAVNPEIRNADRVGAGQSIKLPTAERIQELQETRAAQAAQQQKQQVAQQKQQQQAAEAQAEAAPVNYTVRQGDTLSQIAARHPVTLEELVAANKIKDPTRLQIGQQLVIPPPTQPPASPQWEIDPQTRQLIWNAEHAGEGRYGAPGQPAFPGMPQPGSPVTAYLDPGTDSSQPALPGGIRGDYTVGQQYPYEQWESAFNQAIRQARTAAMSRYPTFEQLSAPEQRLLTLHAYNNGSNWKNLYGGMKANNPEQVQSEYRLRVPEHLPGLEFRNRYIGNSIIPEVISEIEQRTAPTPTPTPTPTPVPLPVARMQAKQGRDHLRLKHAIGQAGAAVGIPAPTKPGTSRERAMRLWAHVNHDPQARLDDLQQRIVALEAAGEDDKGTAGADTVLSAYWLERALPAQRQLAQQARALAFNRIPEEQVDARLAQLEQASQAIGQKAASDLPDMSGDQLIDALACSRQGRTVLATAFNMRGRKRAAYISGDLERFKQAQDQQNNSWIGVDLDGTLAEHTTGEYQPTRIGKPIERMVNRVRRWLADGQTVKIFTARAGSGQDVEQAIKDWCAEHIGQQLEITNTKDKNCIEIYDDRARQVIQNTGKLVGAKITDDQGEPKLELGVEQVEDPEDTWTGMAKYEESPDHGMLFPHAGPLCMRGMKHELAALFLDHGMKVIDIKIMPANDPTGCRKSYRSDAPGACRVLELPSWMTSVVELAPGDKLEISD